MSSLPFPVVGVGASAGGVEALEGFFLGLANPPSLAVVIVTHLNPERESRLREVISRFTRLPVHTAEDDQAVMQDHVYIMPPNTTLGIENGRLRLHPLEPGPRDRRPVDAFFGELALDQREYAVGVVLSGGDGDGSLGIKAIKEYGGLVLAQASGSFGPQQPGMPDSAIATGAVDFAVPVGQMGKCLVDFTRGLAVLEGLDGETEGSNAGRDLRDARQEICELLRRQIGHDFSDYKPSTFLRRVQRRMQVIHMETVGGYLEVLRREPQEVVALFRDLLISVTTFFRDAEAFDALANLVVPKMFEGRGAGDAVRVWVPGCATGEEVYSIAILLREYMAGLDEVPQVQIFATDIDERALGVARAGRYPAALLDGVSAERRTRYFVPDSGSYVVAKEVRDLCVFSAHSILRDPPFSRIDLISCRNLLIYFGTQAQRQVIPIFHYALRPNGHLFLGISENIGGSPDLFVSIERKHRVFRRRSDMASGVRMPMLVGRHRTELGSPPATNRRMPSGTSLRTAVEVQVLERFAPPFVLVNSSGDIVYYSMRTGKYLEAPHGAPTRQLLSAARKGLRLDLRMLLREALESGRTAARGAVAVEGDDGQVQMVTVAVEPLRDSGGEEPLLLVLFTDEGPVLSREEVVNRRLVTYDAVAQRLEQELRETRDQLQSLVEEYETAMEELKASNEELVSLNEELQSTNEELEVSKEELQSVNEEMQTVNIELIGKVEALDRANDDLRNLFESTDIATIFLDRELRIRSFTPAATRVFHLLPTDQGRPITDLASQMSLKELTQDINGVLANGQPFERRVAHSGGQINYLVRLSPYRDRGQRVDGVLVTFIDVSSLHLAEVQQRLLIAELQHRTRNLLNVVQVIIVQTLGKAHTPQALMERLAALGRVQSLLSETKSEEVDLREILNLELRAFLKAGDERVTLDGPQVLLGIENVQIIALALHELVTNAIKHGALNVPTGKLDIRWRVDQGEGTPMLVMDWMESGVPLAAPPTRRGFGRELIERGLAYATEARAEVTFNGDGAACHITMPVPKGAAIAAGQG